MVDFIRSPLFTRHGFLHGFSQRGGGVSEGPFSSGNLGRGIGDAAEAVAENHLRLAKGIGYERVFELSQVHGKALRAVTKTEVPEVVRKEDGDALITRDAGVAVGVRTADCVPVLLANQRNGDVAAVHAGWRGCVKNIVADTVTSLGNPGDIIACIGPHISHLAFEVGPDVGAEIQDAAGLTDVVVNVYDPESPLIQYSLRMTGHEVKPGQHYANLNRLVMLQLQRSGLHAANIDSLIPDNCTFIHKDRYFSYRRDGETGRHLSVIVAK